VSLLVFVNHPTRLGLLRAFLLGNLYFKLKKFKDAVNWLERAVQLEPNNAKMRVVFGIALSHQKKYREAIAQIEQAVKIQPQDSEVQLFLGQLYLLEKDRQSAQTQYKKLVVLNPLMAQKLYTAIYANLLVTAKK
jgi:tetratricopeptide (TPR) repeat protein